MKLKIVIAALLSLVLMGCDNQGSTQSTKESYTLGQKIVLIEKSQLPETTDPLVVKTEAQLKQVSILTGLEPKDVGDKVMATKKLINKHRNHPVTFFDIMDWLTASDEVGLMLTGKAAKFDEVLAIYATNAGA